MKLWVMAGLAFVAAAPFANAETTTSACDVDDTQRATHQRVDTPAEQPRAQQADGSARAAVPPPAVRREGGGGARSDRQRRRSVSRRIPDAELIGGRGAL